jgi:hypothetical protein
VGAAWECLCLVYKDDVCLVPSASLIHPHPHKHQRQFPQTSAQPTYKASSNFHHTRHPQAITFSSNTYNQQCVSSAPSSTSPARARSRKSSTKMSPRQTCALSMAVRSTDLVRRHRARGTSSESRWGMVNSNRDREGYEVKDRGPIGIVGTQEYCVLFIMMGRTPAGCSCALYVLI